MKAQCQIIAEWAKPFTDTPNLMNIASGPQLDREALPLYEDAAFEPNFGI
jgi:hypothetical protein